jgi:hypothetical protein
MRPDVLTPRRIEQTQRYMHDIQKALSGALDKAKQLWTGSKRCRLQTDAPTASDPSPVGATLSSTQGLLPVEAIQDVSD